MDVPLEDCNIIYLYVGYSAFLRRAHIGYTFP